LFSQKQAPKVFDQKAKTLSSSTPMLSKKVAQNYCTVTSIAGKYCLVNVLFYRIVPRKNRHMHHGDFFFAIT